MTPAELKQFIQFDLKDRWPKWTPSDTTIKDVASWFKQYAFDIASKAAQQHKQSFGGAWEPDISKILSICKDMVRSHKSTTDVRVIAVYDDGLRLSCVFQLTGLIEVTDDIYADCMAKYRYYLINENHYTQHGIEDLRLFINERDANELSDQRQEVHLRRVQSQPRQGGLARDIKMLGLLPRNQVQNSIS